MIRSFARIILVVAVSTTTSQDVKADTSLGKITQIIGPVMDIKFPAGSIPTIYSCLRILSETEDGETLNVTAEVQQLLGDNLVRAVALSGTEGLKRGLWA